MSGGKSQEASPRPLDQVEKMSAAHGQRAREAKEAQPLNARSNFPNVISNFVSFLLSSLKLWLLELKGKVCSILKMLVLALPTCSEGCRGLYLCGPEPVQEAEPHLTVPQRKNHFCLHEGFTETILHPNKCQHKASDTKVAMGEPRYLSEATEDFVSCLLFLAICTGMHFSRASEHWAFGVHLQLCLLLSLS